MNDMTHIPASIAKQPIDPNADTTEVGNIALKLEIKALTEIKYKEFCETTLKDYNPAHQILEMKCSNPKCDVVNYHVHVSYLLFMFRMRPNTGCRVCGSKMVCNIMERTKELKEY